MALDRIPDAHPTAQNRDLPGSVADLLEKFQREATDSGALTYAAEIVRLVREHVAREILAERHHLTTGMYPADAQWLRALDAASVIATHGASS